MVPAQTRLTIGIGEDLGNVVPVIEQRGHFTAAEPVEGQSPRRIAFYVYCVLCVVMAVVGFLCFWIICKFQKILSDFGLPSIGDRKLVSF